VNFDRNGLLIDALISKTEPEIIQKIKEGVLNKFSIRGQVLERERKFMPELNRTVNVIKKMTLVEVSLVSVPANPEARAVGWYVSKALAEIDQQSQGGTTMPEDQVVIEEIRPEAGDPPQPSAPAAAAPKPAAAKPEPAPQPAEVSKFAPAKAEPLCAVLDKIAALGGEAKPLAERVKALLAAPAEPVPPAAAPQPAVKPVGRDELGKMIAGEVTRQVEAALKALPTLRKGLVQPDAEQDDVRKQFESLTPERKLKVALALQQG
ncbi:MAG: HK97 family phage prohead protease, partial [Elusimicrobiota bacterium]